MAPQDFTDMDDSAQCALILSKLDGVPSRTARVEFTGWKSVATIAFMISPETFEHGDSYQWACFKESVRGCLWHMWRRRIVEREKLKSYSNAWFFRRNEKYDPPSEPEEPLVVVE